MFDSWSRAELIGLGAILVNLGGFGMTLLGMAIYVGGLKTKVETMWAWYVDHDEKLSESIEVKVGHTVRAALQNFYLRLDEMGRRIRGSSG